MTAQAIVDRLDFCRQSGSGEWLARCPAHQDRSPSLSIKQLDDGRVLIHCHAGCGALDIITAVGLEWGALFPEGDREYHRLQQKRRQETVDELVLEIAFSDMERGAKFSREDKDRLRAAMHRVNNKLPSPEQAKPVTNAARALTGREAERAAVMRGKDS